MAADKGILLVLLFALLDVFPLFVQKHAEFFQFLVLARDLTLFRLQFLKKDHFTIKGSSRRAEKSRKVLMMMMKAAKLGWAGPGAGQEQGWSKARAGLKHERGRTRAGTEQEQS